MLAIRHRRQREQHRRHVEQLASRQFGEMSSRDIEIFNFAQKVGYTRGYNAKYSAERRKAAR